MSTAHDQHPSPDTLEYDARVYKVPRRRALAAGIGMVCWLAACAEAGPKPETGSMLEATPRTARKVADGMSFVPPRQTEWSTAYVGADARQLMLTRLNPSIGYESTITVLKVNGTIASNDYGASAAALAEQDVRKQRWQAIKAQAQTWTLHNRSAVCAQVVLSGELAPPKPDQPTPAPADSAAGKNSADPNGSESSADAGNGTTGGTTGEMGEMGDKSSQDAQPSVPSAKDTEPPPPPTLVEEIRLYCNNPARPGTLVLLQYHQQYQVLNSRDRNFRRDAYTMFETVELQSIR